MKQTQKIYQLDIIRAIAILLVLVVHSTELIYYAKGHYQLSDYDGMQRIIFITLFTLGRLGVPLFMLLTGYLMLRREYNPKSLNLYYKKRVWSLYKKIVLGIIGLTVYDVFFQKKPFDLTLLLKQILLVENLPGIQTWYMPMILSVYLLIPFVANALRNVNKNMILALMSVVFFYFFVIRDLNLLLEVIQLPTLAVVVDFGFISSQGFIIVLGWLLYQGAFRKISSINLLVFIIIGFGGLVYYQYYSFEVGVNYLVWYTNGLLTVLGLCLFELLNRIELYQEVTLVRLISEASFGIFWVHSIVQDILWPYVNKINNHLIAVIILSVSNLFISFIVVKSYQTIGQISKKYFGTR